MFFDTIYIYIHWKCLFCTFRKCCINSGEKPCSFLWVCLGYSFKINHPYSSIIWSRCLNWFGSASIHHQIFFQEAFRIASPWANKVIRCFLFFAILKKMMTCFFCAPQPLKKKHRKSYRFTVWPQSPQVCIASMSVAQIVCWEIGVKLVNVGELKRAFCQRWIRNGWRTWKCCYST